jgi:hypothetical protein
MTPAARRIAERRTARQHDGIDPLDERHRIEQLGRGRRGAAADINRRHRGFLAKDGGGAGDAGHVLGLADQQPRHVGDQIARTGLGQISPRFILRPEGRHVRRSEIASLRSQ